MARLAAANMEWKEVGLSEVMHDLKATMPPYQFTGMTVLKLVLMSFTLGLFVGVMLTVLAEMLLR